MNHDLDSFWLAVTTAVPILALALVVEARTITREWTLATSRIYRIIQSTIWAIALISLASVEVGGLHTLRGGKVPSWLGDLAEYSVGFALGILLVAPVLSFVAKSQAELVAQLVTFSPKKVWKAWRLMRAAKRYDAKAQEMMRQGAVQFAEMFALLDANEKLNREALEAAAALGKGTDKYQVALQEIDERRTDWKRRHEEFMAKSIIYASSRREYKEAMSEYRIKVADERRRIAETLLSVESKSSDDSRDA